MSFWWWSFFLNSKTPLVLCAALGWLQVLSRLLPHLTDLRFAGSEPPLPRHTLAVPCIPSSDLPPWLLACHLSVVLSLLMACVSRGPLPCREVQATAVARSGVTCAE